ncbi:LysR family transcriptional regulator [Pseudomonas lijiangensis]|uniref:LysR family transcriptional regulator n=1 Tax=Pseudomonas lijiangensis TaxID=2995658 RepID=A0ABX8HV29_9PSED|nr:LysR family transcriptional regulator [Pseudomonas lijiangensis]MBX8498824.1 LysR family transcriptional regulator [Pseudomonas lijiangensis]MBX8504307.1 LysR family transcriptional regulator [Pseudomonas lijiangensis]QWU84205.1 LysR family transcriptional regulator [Pseudomonas lijiangensis]
MITIEDLRLAVTLARSESLSAAARTLNVSPPALSMRLRKLEALLGSSLASRDARRLSLTAEGERFARESAILLERLEALPESFKQPDDQLTGTLRLAAPFGYGRQRIAPLLARFAKLHPGLRLHLDLRETPWPDRHDSDAVIHIGSINDSSWVARTLVQNERWLCASPQYLKTHGVPQSPAELANHRCICIRENEEDVTLWHLRKQTARHTVRIEPAMLCNDGSVARRWAEQDQGLVLRSEWDVSDAVQTGALVRVLADWSFESAPILLLVPSRKHRSARMQALMGFLEASLK